MGIYYQWIGDRKPALYMYKITPLDEGNYAVETVIEFRGEFQFVHLGQHELPFTFDESRLLIIAPIGAAIPENIVNTVISRIHEFHFSHEWKRPDYG